MVYQIYYGDKRPRKILFDIEIYLTEVVEDDNMYYGDWYVELHSHSFISGVVDYIIDKNNLNKVQSNTSLIIDFEEFKKDCEELEELRGWLWENNNNRPRPKTEASNDLYKEGGWRDYVRNKVYEFAKKYSLNVNED